MSNIDLSLAWVGGGSRIRDFYSPRAQDCGLLGLEVGGGHLVLSGRGSSVSIQVAKVIF